MNKAAIPSDKPWRLAYRPDIEGLRAVAILLVVAAHARAPGLAGGFVGVDVFFVLSGFLITGLLATELRSTGKIAFAAFYARRFRRLLPALLLMIVVSCGLGALLLTQAEQVTQSLTAATAAVWFSNFHFALGKLNYFTSGAETNLFLHTWSLGVEEQFYLIWPALLMFAVGGMASDRQIKSVMLVVFILSLALCLVLTTTQPLWAFYLMPTRAWQFALGALVWLQFAPTVPVQPALGAGERRAENAFAPLAALAGWVGLGLILAAAWLLDGRHAYPGAWALLPSCGTALVLASGTRQRSKGVGRLLELPPMMAIGRVSYAWYLWHWPVLLLGATLLDMQSGWNRAALAGLSLVIAALSYQFLESPLRHNNRLVARPAYALLGAFALMVVVNATAIRWNASATARVTESAGSPHERARMDGPAIYAMPCDEWFHSAQVRVCAFGPANAQHTVVAFGDSMGLQWFPAIAAIFERPDWRLLVLTKSACPMADVPYFYPRIGREYTECSTWRKQALVEIANLKPDIIILGSSYTYGFNKEQWIDGTMRILQAISPVAERVHVIRSTPVLPFNAPECVAPRSRIFEMLSSKGRCTASAHDQQGDDVFQWLQEAAKPFSNVDVLDMNDAVCPDGICRAEQNGMIAFRDSQHMTASYARAIADSLAARMGMLASPGDTQASSNAE